MDIDNVQNCCLQQTMCGNLQGTRQSVARTRWPFVHEDRPSCFPGMYYNLSCIAHDYLLRTCWHPIRQPRWEQYPVPETLHTRPRICRRLKIATSSSGWLLSVDLFVLRFILSVKGRSLCPSNNKQCGTLGTYLHQVPSTPDQTTNYATLKYLSTTLIVRSFLESWISWFWDAAWNLEVFFSC